LDILEYCKKKDLLDREQYYLQNLKPLYNILKTSGSLLGFKHSKTSIEKIRNALLGKKRSKSTILQIEKGNIQKISVLVIKNKNGEMRNFSSIRKAAIYINKHPSYISKCIKKDNIYKGQNYLIKPQYQ